MAVVGPPVWGSGVWGDLVWGPNVWPSSGVSIQLEPDMNTRLLLYLQAYYSVTNPDLTTLATRYMNGLTTGDRNQKFKQMMQDATDAMP